MLSQRFQRCILQAAVLLLLSLCCQAQQWQGILTPPSSTQKNIARSGIDWSTAGIPGGIPSGRWTQCGATLQASTFGNGVVDATAAINAAIRTCGSNQYVLLSPGTFLVNSAKAGSPVIRLNKTGVALRGSGAARTILISTGTNVGNMTGGIVTLGSVVDPGRGYGTNNPVTNSVNIISGATAGSTSIVVDNHWYFARGNNMIVHELNDPGYVTHVGTLGACTWCDASWNGTRSRGQIVEITSVKGNTITFSPPLYTAYTLIPQALPYTPVKYAGLENLQIVSNKTHDTTQSNTPILMYTCSYCWVKGVEENYADGDYVKIFSGFHNEVRDSYFSNNFHHGPGQNNGAVTLCSKTTASKVENNIIERAENPILVWGGAAGNVIAYNYATGAFGVPSTIGGPMEWHGAHPQFNLVEGNVTSGLWLDVVWGSNSQTTSFRNWYLGTSRVCSPTNETRGMVNCSGAAGNWTYDALRGISVDSLSTYNNLIGDVIGPPPQFVPVAAFDSVQWPGTRIYRRFYYGLSFGYTGLGDSGSNSFDSTLPYATTFLHGVYNGVNDSTLWASETTHALPPSFYLSGKPRWWDNNMSFPAIGPDVTGGMEPGGHVNLIPAQSCFLNKMKGAEGGEGGPYTFDADWCYYSSGLQ